MAPAAWSNAAHGEAAGHVALPVALAVLPALGAVSVVAGWRGAGGSRPALGATLGAGLVWAVAVAGAQLPGVGSSTPTRPGDLRISTRNAEFSTGRLATRPGPTGIVVTNHDLFWHTFTIEELGIDVRVPVGATRRVAADLEPGTYTFACAIPGHKAMGMKGTLTVR
jgi:plastocyanin